MGLYYNTEMKANISKKKLLTYGVLRWICCYVDLCISIGFT
jgi:hypothetical protein